jgi:hypothetical protein
MLCFANSAGSWTERDKRRETNGERQAERGKQRETDRERQRERELERELFFETDRNLPRKVSFFWGRSLHSNERDPKLTINRVKR